MVGLKGVTVADGPPSTKELENTDKTDLRLRSLCRRRMKVTAPITASKAAIPPMAAPAIAPVWDDPFCGAIVVWGGPLAVMATEGTLQVESLSGIKQFRESAARTSTLMVQT
jgi:hypothetical protein